MSRNSDLYEQDFYTWTQTTAALIRAGKWLDIDPESLAEEVESLGKSQQRELASRLDVLLMHLLKWRYQPERRQTGQSWRSTIRTQRRELRRLLMQNPGLTSLVDLTIADSYAEARLDAADETGLPLTTFPPVCPWTPAQIVDAAFLPEADGHAGAPQRPVG
jgi:Domain of unknown function DUF29